MNHPSGYFEVIDQDEITRGVVNMKRTAKSFQTRGNCATSGNVGILPAFSMIYGLNAGGTGKAGRFCNYRAIVIIAAVFICVHLLCGPVQALESGSYRLLSISESEKLVLVSRIPDQRKFLLDAADVKVTINDKPAEFSDLALFTIVQVEMDLKRKRRKGVNVDGDAREIAVTDPAEISPPHAGGE